MPPQEKENVDTVVTEEEYEYDDKLVAPSAGPMKYEIYKGNEIEVYLFLIYFISSFYAAYVCITTAKLPTIAFTLLTVIPSTLGITAGVHRLWSHKSYKVKPALEILLIFFYLMANQRSIVTWVRTHRLHHKYSDTDADPHNATRGFLFSHLLWMIVTPHPEVQKREKLIDVSDLMNNPLIRFQEKYIHPLLLVVAYALPTYIPTLWGESLYVSFLSNIFRMNIVLHMANSINSIAHLIGYKPIDKTVPGTQTQFMGLLVCGEGFHNYHHTYPYDYRASEIGDVRLNLATRFINFMAKIGLAYDLKTTSEDTIRARVLKKGDGTDQYYIPKNEGKQSFFTLKMYKNT